MTSSKSEPGLTPLRLHHQLIAELTVRPGEPADLAHRSTSDTKTDWLGPIGVSGARAVAARHLEESKVALAAAQELLYSSDTWSLLVIVQALDAGGKDGTIKHVMSGVNPQGCVVVNLALVDSFEARTATEAARAASGQPRARRRRRSILAALSVPTSHPPP
jgi:hypothetical protein